MKVKVKLSKKAIAKALAKHPKLDKNFNEIPDVIGSQDPKDAWTKEHDAELSKIREELKAEREQELLNFMAWCLESSAVSVVKPELFTKENAVQFKLITPDYSTAGYPLIEKVLSGPELIQAWRNRSTDKIRTTPRPIEQ